MSLKRFLLFAAIAIPALCEDLTKRVTYEEAMRAATAKTAPSYSPMARQLRLEGKVDLDVTINEEGTVDTVATVNGNPVLAKCAHEALKQWKFTPFKSDAKPVKARVAMSFTFKL